VISLRMAIFVDTVGGNLYHIAGRLGASTDMSAVMARFVLMLPCAVTVGPGIMVAPAPAPIMAEWTVT